MKPYGISAIAWENRTDRIRIVANGAAEILRLDLQVSTVDIQHNDAYIGQEYGMLTPECANAINLLAQTKGVFLNPAYSAKTMVGLIDHVRQKRLTDRETVIFVHCEGTLNFLSSNQELSYDSCG